ncbi:MAG: AraC family transcriptional regulator [Bacteroidales bacterium]|nr:AraC family transcriptional regulator [Bacteroidales bacterium]
MKKKAIQTSIGVSAIFLELMFYFFIIRTKKSKDKATSNEFDAIPEKLLSYKTREPKDIDEVNFVENADNFVDSDCIKPSSDNYQNKFYIAISTNYQDPDFDVKALCLEMGISRTKCYSDVFAMYKKTPKDLINDYRLTQGLILLKGSNLAIGEISSEIGFKSHRGFTKGFKRKFGYAPSQIVPFYHN